MKKPFTIAASLAALLALVAASCTTPPSGGGGDLPDFRFSANRVTVVNHNDSFLYGIRDEPFVLNLWFRVKVGVPGSAQVGVTGDRSNAYSDLGDGESLALSGARQSSVDFHNVELMDLGDFANPDRDLEIVGTWTWAMEADVAGVGSVASAAATIARNALNTIIGEGSLPSDPNDLVPLLLGDFGAAFNLIAGGLFNSIPGVPDDAVGSRFYIGVGATGALGSIIDAAVPNNAFPSVAIPIVTVPPDIEGGQIFSLGHNNSFTGESFSSGGGRHDYDLSMSNIATLPKPPVASFTASATSGSPGLQVNFNSSASSDPDGTIVARNWNFGDFSTGSGQQVSHTFNTAGTFPVTLTVTDDSGLSHSTTTNISVGGAPTSAPTGLAKVGSGCCNTYGDFIWNPLPGATAYEVRLDGFLGGGCVTDHSAVINGQASSGRVQAFGLCLGSQYDVTIRAKANNQWGPWSAPMRITL